jgi:hypothetical protein
LNLTITLTKYIVKIEVSVVLSPLLCVTFKKKNKIKFPFGVKFTLTVREGKFGDMASLHSQESILFFG